VDAVRSCTALKTLDLNGCVELKNEAVLALSSLPALIYLYLCACDKVMAAGVQALRNTTASTNLRIYS